MIASRQRRVAQSSIGWTAGSGAMPDGIINSPVGGVGVILGKPRVSGTAAMRSPASLFADFDGPSVCRWCCITENSSGCSPPLSKDSLSIVPRSSAPVVLRLFLAVDRFLAAASISISARTLDSTSSVLASLIDFVELLLYVIIEGRVNSQAVFFGSSPWGRKAS